jgi:hypothetical protein
VVVVAANPEGFAALLALASNGAQRGWALSVCVAAREAGGSFRSTLQPRREGQIVGPAADPVRAAEEAARRARSKVRKYCAANRLNRLGTLTYRGVGCHDPLAARRDVAAFFRSMRALLGGRPLAYVWVPEWHPGGHGLHVHFAVGRYIRRSVIEAAWPYGFVHIKLLGDLPVGSGAVAEARVAAGYLSGYVGKAFHAARIPGLHRYEVAEGFQPKITVVWGDSRHEAIDNACALMGAEPSVFWSSDQVETWQGPPALWMQWPG